ncbi:MAG: DUF4136 domain-containing protein, partial [Burkholderiales bacterium]
SALSAPATATTYRFERLPLEQIDSAAQASLEAMAAEALAKVGLRQVGADARLAVQVAAQVTRLDAGPWASPWGAPGPGWHVGIGFGGGYAGSGGGWAAWPGFGLGYYDYLPPPPRYWREVSIVMRDAATGKVAYQTRAQSDSGWWDSNVVLPVMFEAAVQGFPQPPPGVRMVRIGVEPKVR